MERKISARFELSGENEYRTKVQSINESLKTMNSEMTKQTAQFAGNQNSMAALTEKSKLLERQYTAQTEKVAAMKGALAAAQNTQGQWGAKLEESRARVASLSEQLEKLKTAEGDTTEEQAKLRAELDKAKEAQASAERGLSAAEKATESWTRKVNYAEADLTKLDSEVQKNQKYLDEAKNSTDGAAKSIDGYGKAAKEAGEGSSLFGQLGEGAAAKVAGAFSAAGVAAILAKLGKEFIEVAKQTDEARSTIVKYTGAAGENLEALQATLKETMAEVKTDMAATSAITGALNTRLGVTEDQLNKNTKAFAEFSIATGEDGAAAVEYVADLLYTYGKNAADIPGILDKLTAAGQYSDAAVSQFAKSLNDSAYYAQQNGISLDQMIAIYAEFEKRGISSTVVYNGVKHSVDEMSKTGRTFTDVLAGIQDGSISSAEAVEIFGARGANLAAVLRSGSFDLEAANKVMAESSGLMEETAHNAATFEDKWQGAWNRILHATREQRVADAEYLEKIEQFGSAEAYAASLGEKAVEESIVSRRAQAEAIADAAVQLDKLTDSTAASAAATGEMLAFLRDGEGQILSTADGYDDLVSTLGSLQGEYNKLQSAYAEADKKNREQINNLMGLFNELDTTTKKSVGDMIGALDSQLKWMDNYADNMAAATKRGVNEGLLKSLSDGSQASAEILAGLKDATDEEITALNEKWVRTQEGKETFNNTLKQMQTDFDEKSAALKEEYDAAVESFNQRAKAMANGAATIAGVIDGANSQIDFVNQAYYSLGMQARKAFESGSKAASVPTAERYTNDAARNYATLPSAPSIQNLPPTKSAPAVADQAAQQSDVAGAVREGMEGMQVIIGSDVIGYVDAGLGAAKKYDGRWR